MTTKLPQRPRKPRAKKAEPPRQMVQGQPPGLPPLIQVVDGTLDDGTIVLQFVFTVPVDDTFVGSLGQNLLKRLAKKQAASPLQVPKLVLPKDIGGGKTR